MSYAKEIGCCNTCKYFNYHNDNEICVCWFFCNNKKRKGKAGDLDINKVNGKCKLYKKMRFGKKHFND